MKQIHTGYEVRAPTRQRISVLTHNRRKNTAVFLCSNTKTQFFIAAKRQKVRKNIWHFLLRQSVYFKRS